MDVVTNEIDVTNFVESLNGQHNYINHKGKGSGNSTRGKFTLEQSDNNYRRSLGKSKTRNSGSQRQLSVEQSKAAGREKLLQEAAGVTVPDNGVAGPSRGKHIIGYYLDLSTLSLSSSIGM